MGKKGKKAQAGKPKKLKPKDVSKRLDALVKKLEEELTGADLYAPLPPTEDCAICLVPVSRLVSDTYYNFCCGNFICVACSKENEAAIKKQNGEKSAGKKVALTCPFCREARPTCNAEEHAQIEARCLQNDPYAFTMMGEMYRYGDRQVAKDDLRALDCWIRAVELGSPDACINIGICYNEGNGVSVDVERAALFERVGALRDIYNADGKHPGKEFISKEYLDFAYRACHGAQMEVKTEERDKHCIAEECTCVDCGCKC